MTSSMFITEDVRDLTEGELRSKFLSISNDVCRMELEDQRLPQAKASLHVISRELILRRLRGPRLG